MDFTTALYTAVGTLWAALISMCFWWRASYKRIEDKLDLKDEEYRTLMEDRDQEREKLWERVAHLEQFQGMIASCPAMKCPYRERGTGRGIPAVPKPPGFPGNA